MSSAITHAVARAGAALRVALILGTFALVAATSPALTAGILVPLEGEPASGNVVGINEKGVLLEGGAEPVPTEEILRLENAVPTDQNTEVSPAVFLIGGGSIPIRKVVFDPDEEEFQIEAADGSKQNLLIDVVGALLLQPKVDSERFNELRAEPTADFDRLLFDVGAEVQVVRGFMLEFGEENITADVDGEERVFPRNKITGIILAGVKPDRSDDWVEVSTVDGSVFEADSVSLDSGTLSVDLGGGEPLKLPWETVAGLSFFSPRVVHLSGERPVSVSTAPIVSLPREPRAGSNVLGGKLVIGGRTFNRGLGIPGGGQMTFSSEGFERFQATVGIDDITGGKGDCEVVVLAGLDEVFRGRIKGGEPPLRINVDLKGAAEVTLKVVPGADLDLADYADWGDAVLIRGE